MKIIYSELNPIYSSYTFPYAVYAIPDSLEEIPTIYQKGFLPYSADPSSDKIVFYLARSVRVQLTDFADSSENRRVDRKIDLEIEHRMLPAADFDIQNTDFRTLCLEYIAERFPTGAMPVERFDYLLRHPLCTHFLDFRSKNGKRIGTVLCSVHDAMMHYWFAFFDPHLLREIPLGKWLMWRTIHIAGSLQLKYIYLGTCYGTKSLYKARDFKGIRFFEGSTWSPDLKELKKRCKEDENTSYIDRYKRDQLL